MKSILAALVAASFAVPAYADFVATNDAGDELRLMNTPCDHADILAMLKPEYHAEFKRAQATLSGDTLRSCWVAIPGEKLVYIQFESGQGQVLPEQIFKEQGI